MKVTQEFVVGLVLPSVPALPLSANEARVMTEVLSIVHAGEPVSKSRARWNKVQNRTYTPQKTIDAQESLGWAMRGALRGRKPDAASFFAVTVYFHTKGWQRRDIDNLVKLVFDAATGIVWEDDSQVVELHARMYPAAVEPRTELTVSTVDDVEARPSRPCGRCGEPMRLFPSTPARKYCSQACAGASRRVRVTVACNGCGKSIERTPAHISEENWCSRGCRTAHTMETKTCEYCGQLATKAQSQWRGDRAFCSLDCRSAFWREWRREAAKGSCVDCGGPTTKKQYVRCQSCRTAVVKEAARG